MHDGRSVRQSQLPDVQLGVELGHRVQFAEPDPDLPAGPDDAEADGPAQKPPGSVPQAGSGHE